VSEYTNTPKATLPLYPRLAEATRTGRTGYFEVAYEAVDGQCGIVCFMAHGWQEAADLFDRFAIGAPLHTREISPEAFLIWYRAMAKRVRELGGI